MTQGVVTVLLAIQVLGGGAVTLAHARDVVTAPATVEAQHDARCSVLHDAVRCALCHYASAQVVVQGALVTVPAHPTLARVPAIRRIVAVANTAYRTSPARAPPASLS